MQLFTQYILYRYIESTSIEDSMSGIQVSKSESGWIINKDGKSFSVSDKNGNNKWDDNELCKALSGNGNALSAEEIFEAKYQILQAGDGATPAEMAKYEQYQKQKEARDQKLQQQQQYQQQMQQAQTPKKKNFWQKFATISTAIMPMLGGLSGMFMGMGMGSWAYNSGNGNDTALRIMGGTTGAMFGMSSMLSSIAMMKGMNNMPAANMGFNSGYNGGFNSSMTSSLPQVIEAQQQWQDAQNQKMQEYADKIKEQNEQKQAEAKKAQDKKTVQNAISSAKEGDPNKKYLDSLEDLDDEREYTEEEIKNVQKIKNAPQILVNHIGEDGSDKTKLSPQFASKLSAKIQEYKKLDDEGSDNKFKVFTKEQYTSIQNILAKTTLSEADITKLKELYNASKKNNE